MSVEAIRKPFAPDDMVATLRRIADEIEAGEHGLKTTCAVVLGHTEEWPAGDGDKYQNTDFALFGCGPRCDNFTIRGLLLTAATRKLK